MLKVVAMVFHQILTQLSGSESDEDRIVAIAKILSKLTKQNSYM
jgi:hypothetical protein